MTRKEVIEVEATVTQALPNTYFRLSLGKGHSVLAYASGKIRKKHIRIVPGDRVLVELSPYDLKKGRITYRLKEITT